MRIITEGEIKEKETKKTCYKCRTQFAYTASDHETDRDGVYVKCPTCNAFIAVK